MSVEKERRTAGGRRTPIKTIVEIGAGEGGSAAFEAESVDVTTSGMHLRTAYLPEIGEPLICRFETGGKEVVVQGHVTWRNEEACGGDFGVRFSEVDANSLEALRDLAGEVPCDVDDPEQDLAQAVQLRRGTRVRLHIEGLGSPMKARVRDATSAEVMVGSNLEFLKVGRPLDLENIDAGDKRGARIERVNIEVDAASKIPQLVVTLRYLDAPETGDELREQDREPEPVNSQSARDRWDEEEGEPQEDSEEDLARKAGKPDAIWNRLRQVGPRLATFGGKAKDIMNHALDKAKAARTRSKDDSDDASCAPRRTTSPAPGGGLKAAGRKLVREEAIEEEDAPKRNPLRKIPKRAAFIGVAAFIVLFAVLALARKSGSPPAAAAATPPEGSANPAIAAAADMAPGTQAGAMVANIPLFGPTPMSTTEPAQVGSAQPPGGATPPADDKLASAAAAAGGGSDDGSSADEDSSGGDSDSTDSSGDSGGGDKASSKGSKGPKSFAHGKVKNPVVLSVRMASKVKSVRGMSTPMGFTVHIVGAKSKDSVAGLAHRDPRIAAVKIANNGSGSDLTVQFKDGVPPYAVRANGSNIVLAIGRSGGDADGAEKKSANAAKHPKPRKASKHPKH